MKRVTIPVAPNAESFKSNPMGFERAVQDWMNRTKNALEQSSLINDTPCDTPFTVGTYTSTTAVNGTMTGTDIANALCSLIQALTNKGILSPKGPIT